jgi:membrane protein DedA with SNARE-associated domain
LRVFAGVLAGVLRMPFPTFLLFSFVGAVCWATVIGYVGLFFGSSWDKLVHFVGRLDRIALLIIAGIAVMLVLRYLVRRKKASQNQSST